MESRVSLLPSPMPVPPLAFAILVEFDDHFELNGEYPPGQISTPNLEVEYLEVNHERMDTIPVPGFSGKHLEMRTTRAQQFIPFPEGIDKIHSWVDVKGGHFSGYIKKAY